MKGGYDIYIIIVKKWEEKTKFKINFFGTSGNQFNNYS